MKMLHYVKRQSCILHFGGIIWTWRNRNSCEVVILHMFVLIAYGDYGNINAGFMSFYL